MKKECLERNRVSDARYEVNRIRLSKRKKQ